MCRFILSWSKIAHQMWRDNPLSPKKGNNRKNSRGGGWRWQESRGGGRNWKKFQKRGRQYRIQDYVETNNIAEQGGKVNCKNNVPSQDPYIIADNIGLIN